MGKLEFMANKNQSTASGKNLKVDVKSSAASSGRLSPASIYEQLFKTRKRSVGRPAGSDRVFPVVNADPLIQTVAQRRAYAVVHEENRARLAEVFESEIAVLKRRGADVVAKDAGIKVASE